MDYILPGPMLFAVPAYAVRSHEEQEAAWLWWGDQLVSVSDGFFVVRESGRLEFEPRDGD